MIYKFLTLLFIVCLHFTVYSQETTDINTSTISVDSSDFSQFLEGLPDSTSSKIYSIQSNLAKAIDTLQQLTNIALELKSQTIPQDDPNQPSKELDPFIENLGFLTGEVNNLEQAITNLQTSKAVDFELAYIVEIETMLTNELEKLVVPEIKISEKNSALQNNNQDLSQYTFDTHQQADSDLNTFHDCSLKTEIEGKIYTPLRHLFDYTPEKLQEHFIEKDYIYTLAQVVKSDKSFFFNMQIKIHSSLARDTYGGIERGSALRIELINGDKIILYNLKRDFGRYNDQSEKMVYNLVYPIEKDELKSLEKIDIDKIGVIWTTGYEDYNIYEPDFLINHISCLSKEN